MGKAESPPPSLLLDGDMGDVQRGIPNNMTYNRSLNDTSSNFHPFHEEERLREQDMKITYGRIV